jgi:hypothetical protein
VLLEEATDFASDPAAVELRLRIDATTNLGAFDPATGLAIDEPYGTLRERKLVYGLPHLGIDLVGIIPDLPESYSVPLADASAASELLDRVAARSRNGNVRLSAFFTLSGFGKDANVSGGAAAGVVDLPVTVRLDRLLLVTIAGRDQALQPGDEQLALLVDTPVQTRGQPTDALAVARRLGLPTIADRIALPADRAATELSSIFSDYRFRDALIGFFDLAALGLYPDLARDGLDNAVVLNLMTPVERLRVFGDREGSVYSLGNEFERRRALTTFNDQILPDLIARAPAFPIPVVAVKSARLGDYSFDTLDFPLQYSGDTQVVQFASNFDGMRPSQLYAGLPERLALSEPEAERLVSRVGGRDRPLLVFATFGNLVATPQGEGFTIDFVPEEAGLYTGLDLTEQLLAVDIAGLVVAPSQMQAAPRRDVTVAGSDQPWVPQYRVPVLDGRPLMVDGQMPGGSGLAAVATLFSLAANPALFERRELTMPIAHQLGFALADYLSDDGRADLQDGSFRPDYAYLAGANEFAREDTRKRFVADFRDRMTALLPQLPFELSVLRQARVEPFNLDGGYFPVSQDGRSSIARYSYGRGGSRGPRNLQQRPDRRHAAGSGRQVRSRFRLQRLSVRRLPLLGRQPRHGHAFRWQHRQRLYARLARTGPHPPGLSQPRLRGFRPPAASTDPAHRYPAPGCPCRSHRRPDRCCRGGAAGRTGHRVLSPSGARRASDTPPASPAPARSALRDHARGRLPRSARSGASRAAGCAAAAAGTAGRQSAAVRAAATAR